jgi:hypothetical protein
MKIHFSTQSIEALRQFPLTQRMAYLDEAAKKMTIPEKTLLNILKLLVIVPVFILLLRVVNDWTSLLWAGLVLILYPLLVRPIQHSMSVKYLPKVLPKDE